MSLVVIGLLAQRMTGFRPYLPTNHSVQKPTHRICRVKAKTVVPGLDPILMGTFAGDDAVCRRWWQCATSQPDFPECLAVWRGNRVGHVFIFHGVSVASFGG